MLKTVTALVCLMLAFTGSAEAKHRHHRGGHGLICGAVQMAHFGVGSRLALDWPKMFQHTSTPAPEVVVVQRRSGRDSAGNPGGHVSRIVRVISACRAIVADPRGQYERDICRNLVAMVIPGAGVTRVASSEPTPHQRSRSKARTRHTQVAFAPSDRFTPQ